MCVALLDPSDSTICLLAAFGQTASQSLSREMWWCMAGTLASGNMDQNLWFCGGFILTHTCIALSVMSVLDVRPLLAIKVDHPQDEAGLAF